MLVVCTLVCGLAPRWSLLVYLVSNIDDLAPRQPPLSVGSVFAFREPPGSERVDRCADDKQPGIRLRKYKFTYFALFLKFCYLKIELKKKKIRRKAFGEFTLACSISGLVLKWNFATRAKCDPPFGQHPIYFSLRRYRGVAVRLPLFIRYSWCSRSSR